MKKKVLGVAIALAVAVSASTVAFADVKLAVVGPMTGDFAEYGKTFLSAAQIAVDEWNEKGGVLGEQISLVEYDDVNTSEQAASIAEKLVGDDEIKAVLGHFSSGVAMTAAEVYQEEGLALMNGSAAHMDFAKIGDCIYRNNAIYTTDAGTMLQIMDYLGVEKFGIINPNSDAGLSVTKAVEDMVAKYGDQYKPELAVVELYEEGTVDFSASISKFQEAGVQAIYSTGAYAQMGPLLNQYREKDSEVQFVLSAGAFSQEFLELAGESAEGVVFGTSFFYGSENENVQAFTKKFNELYGANPNTFAGQIYDGVYAILYAMEAGGSTDREAVIENLPATDFQGVTGKITFDEEGNCPKQQFFLEIKDGDYHEIPGVLLSQSDWEAEKGFE